MATNYVIYLFFKNENLVYYQTVGIINNLTTLTGYTAEKAMKD